MRSRVDRLLAELKWLLGSMELTEEEGNALIEYIRSLMRPPKEKARA